MSRSGNSTAHKKDPVVIVFLKNASKCHFATFSFIVQRGGEDAKGQKAATNCKIHLSNKFLKRFCFNPKSQ